MNIEEVYSSLMLILEKGFTFLYELILYFNVLYMLKILFKVLLSTRLISHCVKSIIFLLYLFTKTSTALLKYFLSIYY